MSLTRPRYSLGRSRSQESDQPTQHNAMRPLVCSSSRVLSVPFGWVWDVNGYYRELGVPTDATRKQLRIAYQALDGPNDSRLTYVLKQLLDPEIRAAYDAEPLGGRFFDRYIQEDIRRKAKRESTRIAARFPDLPPLTDDEEDQIYDEMLSREGFVFDDTADGLDLDGDGVQDETSFGFSYFAWRCSGDLDKRQVEALCQWQALVGAALGEKGVTTRFAVGLFGRMEHQSLLAHVQRTPVALLKRGATPTPEAARHVVQALIPRERQG